MAHSGEAIERRRRRGRGPGWARLLVLGGAVACAGPVAPSPEPAPPLPASSAAGRVRVLLPAGDCPTGRLELQVFDREAEAWVPHPAHPRLRTGSCLEERADRLLSEIRVRCIDPEGGREPSPWVEGVRLDAPAGPAACAPLPEPALEADPGTE